MGQQARLTLNLVPPKSEEHVSFRQLVDEIPSTTYASHGMYYYPARFIPQVVRWAIDNYTRPDDWIIDPFAGSGTVCVESQITHRNCVSLDLNPVIENLVTAKTFRGATWEKLEDDAHKILSSERTYRPTWSRIGYWHPEPILNLLGRMWGGYYQNPHPLTLIALLKTTRRFSYTHDIVPKLFKSKTKTLEMDGLKHADIHTMIQKYFLNALRSTYRASKSFEEYYTGGTAIVKGGVDLLNYDFEKRKYDLLITSPPYGIAHEYIRSLKLELAWLGFTDERITQLLSHEIPYNRNPPPIEIMSDAFKMSFARVTPKVARHCMTYFQSVLFVLGRVMSLLRTNGTAAIFIGNATFSGVEFPFADIFREHFESRGFVFERLLIDQIKARRLFRGRQNPSPNGISFESLLVLTNAN